MKYIRKYNYARAKCEDPKLIREWFDRFKNMIAEKGILEEDIYNFDESGFSLGLIATCKVVTMSDTMGKPILLQPGNREWVTVIEAINTTRFVVPSYILFKGENHQAK